MTDVRIQPLTSPDEIEDILRIESVSFTNPWTREMYLAELANRGVSYCFLARDERGATAGFCSFWRIVDELHINNLAVLPAFRRRGIASAVSAYLARTAHSRGISLVFLEAEPEEEQIYHRTGFADATAKIWASIR